MTLDVKKKIRSYGAALEDMPPESYAKSRPIFKDDFLRNVIVSIYLLLGQCISISLGPPSIILQPQHFPGNISDQVIDAILLPDLRWELRVKGP